jgi:hypothetical protein
MRRFLVALLLFAAPAAAPAASDMAEIRNGAPVTIRPDRAYILFRTDRPGAVPSVEPILLRIPTAEDADRYYAERLEAFRLAEPAMQRRRETQLRRNREIAASGDRYRNPVDPEPRVENFPYASENLQNVHIVDDAHAYIRGRPESVYLVEAVPGDYVLYGASWRGPSFSVCFCLGTVGFSAPAGVITDLGTFLGDNVSRISEVPELRAESGFGPSVNGYLVLLGGTVRPVPVGGLSAPEVLRGANIRPADYSAVGKFVDSDATAINHLAPVAGVLAYDRGRVIDVRSGREVPDVQAEEAR